MFSQNIPLCYGSSHVGNSTRWSGPQLYCTAWYGLLAKMRRSAPHQRTGPLRVGSYLSLTLHGTHFECQCTITNGQRVLKQIYIAS